MKTNNRNYLIYITGQMNHPFFLNEVEYLKEDFEEIHVIAYDEKDATEDYCSDGVISYKLNHKKYGIRNIANSLKCLGEAWVREEQSYIRQSVSKRFSANLYLFYYILFILKSVDFISEIITGIKNKDPKADIYVYSFWASKGACAAAMLRRKYPNMIKKAVARAHGYDLYEERNRTGYLPFRKFLSMNIDSIFFISNHGMNYYERSMKKHNVRFNKGKLIRLGTKEPNFLKKIGIDTENKDEIVIASCSRIIQIKRLDLIIRLIQRVSKKFNVKWIHLGGGEDKYVKAIEELAEKMIRGKYVFLGEVENNRVFDIYRENDVDWFVNMSDSEGIPVSIMEAISCGIPAVARNVGGNSEIVDDSCGILSDSTEDDSMDQIAEIIVSLARDRERYRKKSEGARKKWESEYSSEKNAKKFVDFLLNIK